MSESSKDRRSSGRPPSSRAGARSGTRPDAGRRKPGADDRPSPRAGEPEIPEDVTWYDLDRATRGELRSLPKELAERVGGHLAMAGHPDRLRPAGRSQPRGSGSPAGVASSRRA